MILTGRAVDAAEALAMGLANRVVPKGQARQRAQELAAELAKLPQQCMRSDRLSTLNQWGIPKPRPWTSNSPASRALRPNHGRARHSSPTGAGRHGASA